MSVNLQVKVQIERLYFDSAEHQVNNLDNHVSRYDGGCKGPYFICR